MREVTERELKHENELEMGSGNVQEDRIGCG